MKNKLCIIILICTCINIYPQIKLSTLEEAIKFGLSHSKTLEQAELSALLQIKGAKLSFDTFLPKFEISWSEYDFVKSHSSDTRNRQINFSVSQPLFDNGKNILQYMLNKYDAQISYYEFLDQKNNYCLSVIEKYFSYILQCRMIELKKSLLENMKKELTIIEYKYKNGIGLKSDFYEYKISCTELENQLQDAVYQKKVILDELKILLNIEPDSILEIDETSPKINYTNKKLSFQSDKLVNRALENDINLKKQLSSIIYISKQNKILDRCFLPSISVQVSMSFTGTTYPLTQPDYSIGVIFSFPDIPFIQPAFSNTYGIKEKKLSSLTNSTAETLNIKPQYTTFKKLSKLSLENEKNSYELNRKNYKQSIINLINEHDRTIDCIELLKKTAEIKKEKILISEYQVENGLLRSAEYIDEKLNLLNTEQEIAKAEVNLLILNKKILFLTNGEKL